LNNYFGADNLWYQGNPANNYAYFQAMKNNYILQITQMCCDFGRIELVLTENMAPQQPSHLASLGRENCYKESDMIKITSCMLKIARPSE